MTRRLLRHTLGMIRSVLERCLVQVSNPLSTRAEIRARKLRRAS